MNHTSSRSIVIIGGGASATLLLAQLSTQLNNHCSQPISIYIIDDSPAFKMGCAYSVTQPSFILNVAANRMGAWNDAPDDFYHWLNDHPSLWRHLHLDFLTAHFQADDFVPRIIYGAYLDWIFENAESLATRKNIQIRKVSARASTINAVTHTSQLIVKLDTQESLVADAVIVATGNLSPKHVQDSCNNIFSSPYHDEFIAEDWQKLNEIIILGSGLSMVDAIQYLEHKHYQGNIQVFSRHGLMPLPHLESGQHQKSTCFDFSGLTSARKILRAIRKQIKLNEDQGVAWQTTIDSLRQGTNTAWLALSVAERKKLKRVLPWWNIARHRIPTTAYKLLIKLKQDGRLTITKGDVRQVEHNGDSFLVNFADKSLSIKADKMVICSGYCYNKQLENLCGNLLQPEMINKATPERLSPHYELYALGPALGGLLIETTAINEIRQQSLKIASAIAQQIHTHTQQLQMI